MQCLCPNPTWPSNNPTQVPVLAKNAFLHVQSEIPLSLIFKKYCISTTVLMRVCLYKQMFVFIHLRQDHELWEGCSVAALSISPCNCQEPNYMRHDHWPRSNLAGSWHQESGRALSPALQTQPAPWARPTTHHWGYLCRRSYKWYKMIHNQCKLNRIFLRFLKSYNS